MFGSAVHGRAINDEKTSDINKDKMNVKCLN
jgi:hypothetical protein